MQHVSVEFKLLVEAEGTLKDGGEDAVEGVAEVVDEAVLLKVKQLLQSLKNQHRRR